jgi:Putative prokaryotic signal transducing protein
MPLVEAARYYNSFEAGAAQSRLEDEGLPSFLFDFEMANYLGGIFIPIRLMVDDEDLEQAQKLLA